MKNLKIGSRLALGFAAVITVFLAVVAAALYSGTRLAETFAAAPAKMAAATSADPAWQQF